MSFLGHYNLYNNRVIVKLYLVIIFLVDLINLVRNNYFESLIKPNIGIMYVGLLMI